MAHLKRPTPPSYFNAVKALNVENVQTDLASAAKSLAQAMTDLIQKFDSIAKQLYIIDLQGLTGPLAPRWSIICQDFKGLIWQARMNAIFLSGRLKMFDSVVLPLTARNSGSSRSQSEKLQVLQSFMSISNDHATLTRSLGAKSVKFNIHLNTFYAEFLRLRSNPKATSSGQSELNDVAQKISKITEHVKKLYIANSKLINADVTYILFSVSRFLALSGRRGGKTKISHEKLAINTADLPIVGKLYEELEHMRNEVTHAHYMSQVSYHNTDVISTTQATLSMLLVEEMLMTETGLSIFLSVWSMLQTDCTGILQWLQTPNSVPSLPPAIASYNENGSGLYAAIARTLDTYSDAFDLSQFADKTSDKGDPSRT